MVEESLERLDPPRKLGHMTLLAKLGEGGMAGVYVASVGHGELTRLAAVKLLRSDTTDHDYKTRFLDEAKLVVRLHHNNLVDVREAGEIEGQLFIAMELVEGRDLADVWDRCAEVGRAFPVPIAVHIVRAVLRGLHYAHTFPDLALVHRDVSPSNILIDWSGAVRLADFGLATSTLKGSVTVPGIVFGKVGYMSPEQALRQGLDGRSDVYSCGVVLWELLTGRPMRDAGVDTQTVASNEAKPPSTMSGRVDPQLDAVVMRALARDPDQRYRTAEDFMLDLGSWISRNAPDTSQETMSAMMRELFADEQRHEHGQFRRLHEELSGKARTMAQSSQPQTRIDPVPVAGELEHIEAGTVIAERYRVLGRLGQGGMGTVYMGEHLTVGRSVAIKVLTHQWSRNEHIVERFRAEARAASAAGHPNIVEVFDAGSLDDGRLYIVMEFLTGHNLYEAVKELGPFDLARACRTIRDVARAIRAAHDVGIIHRDLKPDNVMLVDRGEGETVKVLDFGVSASATRGAGAQRLTMPGHALGTPAYMAPEQARGAEPTESFDIYALGVLLFEMLTGAPPFEADNLVEIMTRKTMERAPSVGTRRSDLPDALVALVDDCLEISPDRRPKNAAEFIERIEDVLRALPRIAPTLAGRTPVTPPETSAGEIPANSSSSGLARPFPMGSSNDRRTYGTLVAGVIAVAAGGLIWFGLAGTGSEEGAQSPAAPSKAAASDSAPAAPVVSANPAAEPQPIAEPPASGAASGTPTAAGAPVAHQPPPDPKPPETAQKPPEWKTDRCAKARASANAARREHNWTKVLRHAKKRGCWQKPTQSVRLHTMALSELGRFSECARVGRGFSDRDVRRLVKLCQSRAKDGS